MIEQMALVMCEILRNREWEDRPSLSWRNPGSVSDADRLAEKVAAQRFFCWFRFCTT
jgi:hypothetical protein